MHSLGNINPIDSSHRKLKEHNKKQDTHYHADSVLLECEVA
jgi:hypothetical protein